MKRIFLLAVCSATLVSFVNLARANDSPPKQPVSKASAPKVVLPKGITEEMLASPPVPGFMLKPPSQQLTVDEMVRQAREAERQSGIKPAVKPVD